MSNSCDGWRFSGPEAPSLCQTSGVLDFNAVVIGRSPHLLALPAQKNSWTDITATVLMGMVNLHRSLKAWFISPRIASHNFVTGCLTSSVTGGGLNLVGFEGFL